MLKLLGASASFILLPFLTRALFLFDEPARARATSAGVHARTVRSVLSDDVETYMVMSGRIQYIMTVVV